jgi:transposase-like protein
MGHKKVCLECRMTLNRPFDSGSEQTYPCPECGNPMTLLPHRFRPPKKTEDKKWETVKFLIENGFYYQHINEIVETKNGVTKYQNYAKYPDNLRDAKEFVEKYKDQARK